MYTHSHKVPVYTTLPGKVDEQQSAAPEGLRQEWRGLEAPRLTLDAARSRRHVRKAGARRFENHLARILIGCHKNSNEVLQDIWRWTARDFARAGKGAPPSAPPHAENNVSPHVRLVFVRTFHRPALPLEGLRRPHSPFPLQPVCAATCRDGREGGGKECWRGRERGHPAPARRRQPAGPSPAATTRQGPAAGTQFQFGLDCGPAWQRARESGDVRLVRRGHALSSSNVVQSQLAPPYKFVQCRPAPHTAAVSSQAARYVTFHLHTSDALLGGNRRGRPFSRVFVV